MATATLQSFNVFLTERLTAAAMDIFGFVEKTILDYQEEVQRTKQENQRLQRLLDLVYKPEIRLHRADSEQIPLPTPTLDQSLQMPPTKEEWIPSVGQEEPGTLPIKEEKPELCPSPVEQCVCPPYSNEGANLTQVITTEQHVETTTTAVGGTDLVPLTSAAPNSMSYIYSCVICGQKFQKKTELAWHLSSHSRKNSLACHICGKVEPSRSDLKRHMVSHTNEKPYVCHICGNRYKMKGHIKEHLRTHTGERPYICYICGKSFNRCTTMSKHARLRHKESKPYRCSHCGQRFPVLVVFRQHMKNIHDVTLPM